MQEGRPVGIAPLFFRRVIPAYAGINLSGIERARHAMPPRNHTLAVVGVSPARQKRISRRVTERAAARRYGFIARVAV
jgi:hypothetical protein